MFRENEMSNQSPEIYHPVAHLLNDGKESVLTPSKPLAITQCNPSWDKDVADMTDIELRNAVGELRVEIVRRGGVEAQLIEHHKYEMSGLAMARRQADEECEGLTQIIKSIRGAEEGSILVQQMKEIDKLKKAGTIAVTVLKAAKDKFEVQHTIHGVLDAAITELEK